MTQKTKPIKPKKARKVYQPLGSLDYFVKAKTEYDAESRLQTAQRMGEEEIEAS